MQYIPYPYRPLFFSSFSRFFAFFKNLRFFSRFFDFFKIFRFFQDFSRFLRFFAFIKLCSLLSRFCDFFKIFRFSRFLDFFQQFLSTSSRFHTVFQKFFISFFKISNTFSRLPRKHTKFIDDTHRTRYPPVLHSRVRMTGERCDSVRGSHVSRGKAKPSGG